MKPGDRPSSVSKRRFDHVSGLFSAHGARYNGWANALIYAAAAEMASEDFARETGAFFGSLKGTLNHVLAADRIWMHRLTGEGETLSRTEHCPAR